jgi:periplasmic divalent cation tolerance protein
MEYIVVYVTAKDRAQGRKIARHLLTKKLVACVNIVNGIESHYRWEGKLEQSKEVLLVIKTSKVLFSKVAQAVKEVHSYQVPEIIALPLVAGEENYLSWLAGETRRETK